jgi:hypothetical protein
VLSDSDKSFLKAALCTGIGLTFSCVKLGLDIREVSKEFTRNQVFLNQCRDEMAKSSKLIIKDAYSDVTKGDLSQSGKSVYAKQLLDFISEIYLWESYCTRKELTPEKVIRAFNIYPVYDVPTVLGMIRKELIDYIFDDDGLFYFAQEIGYIK